MNPEAIMTSVIAGVVQAVISGVALLFFRAMFHDVREKVRGDVAEELTRFEEKYEQRLLRLEDLLMEGKQ